MELTDKFTFVELALEKGFTKEQALFLFEIVELVLTKTKKSINIGPDDWPGNQ